MHNRTIILFIFIITLLLHLSHTYLTLQIFQKLIINHCHYDIIIFIMSLIAIRFYYCHYDIQLYQLYTLYTLLHSIKTLLFLMYVPVVFATVVPDDKGQHSADEDHWPSRSQTPPTPPVQAKPS